VFLERMVIPRSRSRSLESITQWERPSPSRKIARLLQQGIDQSCFWPVVTWALIAILRIGARLSWGAHTAAGSIGTLISVCLARVVSNSLRASADPEAPVPRPS